MICNIIEILVELSYYCAPHNRCGDILTEALNGRLFETDKNARDQSGSNGRHTWFATERNGLHTRELSNPATTPHALGGNRTTDLADIRPGPFRDGF